MAECPNFFRGKKNMFKTDMDVFVIDQNGYDLRRGLIKFFGNNAWTIFYPDTKEVEDIIDTNRLIPYNKDNKRIYYEQERKRNELQNIKSQIDLSSYSADTSPQKRQLDDDVAPKKQTVISSPPKIIRTFVNTDNKAEVSVKEPPPAEIDKEVVNVNDENDKNQTKNTTSASSPNESDIEQKLTKLREERSARLDLLQPSSIEFNTNITKNTTTWTFRISFE